MPRAEFFFPSESSADPDSHRINTWPPWFLLERLLFEKARVSNCAPRVDCFLDSAFVPDGN